MDMIVDIINSIDAFVWGPPMLVLLLGSHIFLTFRTGFIQRKLPTAIKLSVTKDPDAPGDISQFGALCTALSATIGTGNIVGVGTAIIAGGPGAVFWMWITGVFGIATKYSETFAAVKYRVKDHNGDMLGGAMYAWKRGFTDKDGNTPWWALLGAGAFALFAAIASFGIGSAVQSSAMTEVISTNLPGVPAWGIGLAIVIMVSIVIFGGVKVISNVCEKLVPFMAIAYIWGCVVILGMNWELVWPAFCLIVESAFTAKAAFGGALGSGLMLALQFGCARGLFSNESGLGSAPIVASAAATRNPARQALVSMTGTFWDTVIICLLTGLVLVSTMLGNADLQSEIMGRQHHRRRGAVLCGFRQHPLHRHAHPHLRHDSVRLLHHPGLVLLWQPLRHLPVRQARHPPLPGALRGGGLPWRYRRGRGGLDGLRHHQRPYGHPEHHHGAAALRAHREGDAPLCVRGQPRRARRGPHPAA